MYIRPATAKDLIDIQNSNLHCLPENYTMKYFYYHYLSWPDLVHVQVDFTGKVKGYILGKIEDSVEEQLHALRRIEHHDESRVHERADASSSVDPSLRISGHVTSLAVHPFYRKVGIAAELMQIGQNAMRDIYGAGIATLHVRRSNAAAIQLYCRKLKFTVAQTAASYYGDGEDAFEMIKRL